MGSPAAVSWELTGVACTRFTLGRETVSSGRDVSMGAGGMGNGAEVEEGSWAIG